MLYLMQLLSCISSTGRMWSCTLHHPFHCISLWIQRWQGRSTCILSLARFALHWELNFPVLMSHLTCYLDLQLPGWFTCDQLWHQPFESLNGQLSANITQWQLLSQEASFDCHFFGITLNQRVITRGMLWLSLFWNTIKSACLFSIQCWSLWLWSSI